MAVRRTSAKTWEAIQESGLVNRQKLRVYNFLYENGPHTQSEINAILRHKEVNPSFHKRLSELERMGLVESVGERVCRITGRVCMDWTTTDLADPIPPPPPPPTKKEVIAGLEGLLDEVATWLALQEDGISSSQAKKAVTRIQCRMAELKAPKI